MPLHLRGNHSRKILSLPHFPISPNQPDESLDGLFTLRSRLKRVRLDTLVLQFAERLALGQHLENEIQTQLLENGNQLLALGEPSLGHHTASPAWHERDQERQALLNEGRQERRERWQDCTRLLRDILDTWEDYEQAIARERILFREKTNPPPGAYHFPPLYDHAISPQEKKSRTPPLAEPFELPRRQIPPREGDR